MKTKMTREQIDVINELLKEHGEALTAFYDEGISQGVKAGITGFAQGQLITIAVFALIGFGIYELKTKNIISKLKKTES